jgi:hypothetical protein
LSGELITFLRQVQSTDFYQFVDDISNVWNKGGKLNLQSLTICYVDRNVGHQNHGATVVPVTNFAPIPANVHVFGGKAIVQDEPQQVPFPIKKENSYIYF